MNVWMEMCSLQLVGPRVAFVQSSCHVCALTLDYAMLLCLGPGTDLSWAHIIFGMNGDSALRTCSF